MPEGFAFGELQNLIGSLPPVSSCTSLVKTDVVDTQGQCQNLVSFSFYSLINAT
jgi:hypothetical protein